VHSMKIKPTKSGRISVPRVDSPRKRRRRLLPRPCNLRLKLKR